MPLEEKLRQTLRVNSWSNTCMEKMDVRDKNTSLKRCDTTIVKWLAITISRQIDVVTLNQTKERKLDVEYV